MQSRLKNRGTLTTLSGMIMSNDSFPKLAAVAFSALLWATGCGRKESLDGVQISTPQQAAGQLEQAFGNEASADVKQNARVASEALRQGDFEKAVISLQAVRSSDKVTLDQGLAVHGTTVMLESRLIQAIESGDPKAKRAYELLKAMKKK